ncbi:hypothetical protein D3C85_288920 [compost metagenome]
MEPYVSPNSSLKNGPATPAGKVPWMSPIFLRTWYQAAAVSLGGADSRNSSRIKVSPGFE